MVTPVEAKQDWSTTIAAPSLEKLVPACRELIDVLDAGNYQITQEYCHIPTVKAAWDRGIRDVRILKKPNHSPRVRVNRSGYGARADVIFVGADAFIMGVGDGYHEGNSNFHWLQSADGADYKFGIADMWNDAQRLNLFVDAMYAIIALHDIKRAHQ